MGACSSKMGACSSGYFSLVTSGNPCPVHACKFPMQVVSVADFLQSSGPPEPYSTWHTRGLLHKVHPDMFVIFVSHQWLSYTHPDPEGTQLAVLQHVLGGLCEGSFVVEDNILTHIYGLPEHNIDALRTKIANGFLFVDWMCIPQITSRKQGLNEINSDSITADAVESIPHYVEVSNLFVALVPELTHADTRELCNYKSWLTRGWCRGEMGCHLLSNKQNTSVIVIHSTMKAECMSHVDWQFNSIADCGFSVERDRAAVVQLEKTAMAAKVKHLEVVGPLHMYRYYMATSMEEPDSDVSVFLERFRFASLSMAVTETNPMNGVMCATLSGSARLLRILVENQAEVDHHIEGLGAVGYFDSSPMLMLAVSLNKPASLITTLLELRADVNAKDTLGASVTTYLRSKEQADALLQAEPDLDCPGMPMGVTPFTIACTTAPPEAIAALLDARCDPNPPAVGVGWSPLHAACFWSRGSRHAVEKVRLLLDHKADVNAKSGPWNVQSGVGVASQLRAALFGLESCDARTRFFESLSGITPLGMAALMGDHDMAVFLWANGAGLLANDYGYMPEDLASMNSHWGVFKMLSVCSA
ncbi:unnamed protein product [Effrenium voratum]|nr:unnamed protein product [Effrenium voratum]